MITETQRTEIRKYLASKQLPIDIVMEVEDHFVTQIENFENQNVLFNEGFEKTKLIWNNDFKMVKKSFFSFGKVPRIVKDIQTEVTKNLLKKACYISFSLILFGFFIAKTLSEDTYFLVSVGTTALISICTFLMILFYIFSRITKQRTRAEKYFYNQILNIFLLYLFLGFFGGFSKLPMNSFKIIYSYVNQMGVYDLTTFSLCVFQSLFSLTVTIYLFLMMNDRARSITRIKNYKIA